MDYPKPVETTQSALGIFVFGWKRDLLTKE